jgi:CHAT domain-containing protein
MDEIAFQRLQEKFFAALDARYLDICQQVLAEARTQPLEPEQRPWLDYYQAILLVEVSPPRWDQAEQLLLTLLEGEIAPALRARVLLELGLNADWQGDCPLAVERHERSLALFEQLDDTLYQAKSLKNLGIAYTRGYELGQYGPAGLEKALACHQRSLKLCQALGDERLAATVRHALGTVYKALGQWDQALAHYRARVTACRGPDQRHSLGLALNNLGEIYQRLGNWRWATRYYRDALLILREFGDLYETADVLANLASLRRQEGRPAQAQSYYDQAIAAVESMRAALAAETARIGFFSTETHIYEGKLKLCLETGQVAAAFATLERAKSRAFVELLARHFLSGETSEVWQAEPLDLATVQARLPADALLLEYFTAADYAGVFLVSCEKATFTPLPATLPVLRRVFAPEHQTLAHLTPDRHGRLHYPWPLAELYRLLVAPIADRLAGRRLCIVPHGPLHYVPFHALCADASTALPGLVRPGRGSTSQNGQPRYLLDETGIFYAPSATVLLEYCRRKAPSGQTGGLVLAYRGAPSVAGPVLRHAEQEGQGVAGILGGALYGGEQARREAIYKEGGRYRFLHFACHGRFNPRFPLASGLVLADGILDGLNILEQVRLDADLVTLSGCETGLSALRRGDELIGLVRAFMRAGTPSVLVSLWPVDDLSTCILMEQFYRELTSHARLPAPAKSGGPGAEPGRAFGSARHVSAPEALRRAQRHLMTMTEAEVRERLIAYDMDGPAVDAELARLRRAAGEKGAADGNRRPPFAHPYYWAPFCLIGDRLS